MKQFPHISLTCTAEINHKNPCVIAKALFDMASPQPLEIYMLLVPPDFCSEFLYLTLVTEKAKKLQ